jgi:hypothetical protein
VSLAKLIDGDAGTVNELTSACRDIGFFYLDLRNVRTNNILEDVDRTFPSPMACADCLLTRNKSIVPRNSQFPRY